MLRRLSPVTVIADGWVGPGNQVESPAAAPTPPVVEQKVEGTVTSSDALMLRLQETEEILSRRFSNRKTSVRVGHVPPANSPMLFSSVDNPVVPELGLGDLNIVHFEFSAAERAELERRAATKPKSPKPEPGFCFF